MLKSASSNKVFERISQIQMEIIDCYSKLEGYPKYLDIDSLDIVGDKNPQVNDDEDLICLKKLIGIEKFYLDMLRNETPQVYENYVGKAKKRLLAYESNSSLGFVRLNHNWGNYLVARRLVNYNNNDQIRNLAKASFVSNLKIDPEQLKIWLFCNPCLENAVLLNDGYDRAILKEIIGGSCRADISDKRYYQLQEERKNLVSEVENEVLNNLIDYCKRNSGSEQVLNTTVSYLEALRNTGRDRLYDYFLSEKLISIAQASSEYFDSPKFYQNIIEPLEEKSYIKKAY